MAKSIGTERAIDFYLSSIDEMRNVFKESQLKWPQLKCHWAVAEEEALRHPLWEDFPSLWQGEGGLGCRLSKVYSQLNQSCHSIVIFVGGDCPLMKAEHISAAIQGLISKATPSSLKSRDSLPFTNFEGTQAVVGPADDGGFYLFGSSAPLDLAFWQSIPYSSTETKNILLDQLVQRGVQCILLEPLFDVDTVDELNRLHLLNLQQK